MKFIASNSSYVRGVTVTTKSPTFVPVFSTLTMTDPMPSSSLESTSVKPSVSCCPVEVDVHCESTSDMYCVYVFQCSLWRRVVYTRLPLCINLHVDYENSTYYHHGKLVPISQINEVKKFHNYLFDRKFVIRSDNKPLHSNFDLLIIS